MYFYDNSYYGDVGSGMNTLFYDNWYSHYDYGEYIYTNNPDGSFGVYYSPSMFTGNTSDIQNLTSQITKEYCTLMKNNFDTSRETVISAFKNGIAQFPDKKSYRGSINQTSDYPVISEVYTNSNFIYPSFPSIYWDNTLNKCMSSTDPFNTQCCGKEEVLDFNNLMTQSLSSITSVEEFEYFLTTELIDSKSRKTLSSYPTLRALYDRYMNSSNYCGTESSKFDYLTMDKFASLVGDYWIDLVEQVVPATTIWGNAKIYNNTIFDQQKFKYKKYSLFTCINACNEPINKLYSLNDEIYCIIKKDYLLNYDIEELNCTTPSNWNVYKDKANNYFGTYVKCFIGTYHSNILALKNTECKNNILVLYDDWTNNLCADFYAKEVALFTALLTSSTSYIESLYLEYIDALDKVKSTSDEIMLLLNNNCQVLNFNNTIDVDLITITNKNSKLSKCDGIYIKQMDAGSEFIGNIYYYNRR